MRGSVTMKCCGLGLGQTLKRRKRGSKGKRGSKSASKQSLQSQPHSPVINSDSQLTLTRQLCSYIDQ